MQNAYQRVSNGLWFTVVYYNAMKDQVEASAAASVSLASDSWKHHAVHVVMRSRMSRSSLVADVWKSVNQKFHLKITAISSFWLILVASIPVVETSFSILKKVYMSIICIIFTCITNTNIFINAGWTLGSAGNSVILISSKAISATSGIITVLTILNISSRVSVFRRFASKMFVLTR